ncbi:mitochondrial dicarboxylate carrier [Eurytemora carolleeae]|uniref:mitochondrial dicarboxylate carrier n=1 Tax=Eurytemora carolleeae TaxID=1294199 RepID=UPI000C775178|nr:mitochondrial dicarboxylate carrier [Eurytemora carolleeae]|eukprot:XP_023331168.1 mitochondrial dicarboxylate carrier-like [Eurytemora affinis]
MSEQKRMARWYFGGLASAGAACITHPLDLLKVHLQTQTDSKMGVLQQTVKIVKGEGVLALYNGLSASLVRQLTYSTTRFAIYELAKQSAAPNGEKIPFLKSLVMAAVAGGCGGFVGTPGDMVNVRMQNDIKLPLDQRRKRMLMTIGQLCFYDQVKAFLLTTPYFTDGIATHMTASLAAGAIATTMTQPLDVLKTRSMNAKPGEFRGALHLISFTASQGPTAFYKGYLPAFVRLGPHTILTFVFFEQLRMRFGFIPTK